MALDPITEFISHFSGIFSIATEQARMRIEYQPFEFPENENQGQSDIPNININIRINQGFRDYTPGVEYTPSPNFIPPAYTGSQVSHFEHSIYVSAQQFYHNDGGQFPFFLTGGSDGVAFDIPTFAPPGSLALVIRQNNHLQDNDFVDLSGHHSDFVSSIDHQFHLNFLIEQAEALSPITPLAPPSSEEDIAVLIENVAKEIQNFNSQMQADHASAGQAFFNEEATGSFVNGETNSDLPELEENFSLSEQEEPEDTISEEVTYVEAEETIQLETSVTIEAGNNILVNEVSLGSSWSEGSVIAIENDSHSVNVISQINVWSDSDTVQSEISETTTSQNATQAFNLGSITVQAQSPAQSPTLAPDNTADLDFPSFWSITRLDTNLVFLNSIEQVNFVSDNDVHILSSTGTETTLVTGDNLATNFISSVGLASGYDLIFVGGSYYDANIILQTNIILDNDSIGTLGNSDSEDAFDANLSTDSNLLWNQASIHSIGQSTYEAIPDHFSEQSESLMNGSDIISTNVLSDINFAGLVGINVLYVAGNVFDLQYISQTNILTDSDEVAFLAKEFAENSEADWDISTGGNAVINLASIMDAGPDTSFYVKGDHYSDALIHQAELATDIPLNAGDDGLVSEAIVFLIDDMLEGEHHNYESNNAAANNKATTAEVDLMQTMLS